MLRLCLLLVSVLGCDGSRSINVAEVPVAEVPVAEAPSAPRSAATVKKRAVASVSSAAPISKARMPALPRAGWHRVSRALPNRLDNPVWDPKTKQTFALEHPRVFRWDGSAWRLTKHTVGAGQSRLVARPDGLWVVRLDERKLFVHPLGAASPKTLHTVSTVLSGARVEAAWDPKRAQIVIHLLDSRRNETFVFTGKRVQRIVAKAPFVSAIGWDGTRISGVDDLRLYHLEGRRWQLDPERLPANGRVFAPDNALWLQREALKRRMPEGWLSLTLPAGDFYGAALGFDVARDQVLLRANSGPAARRTWVRTTGKSFAPIDMGPWWRPTTEAFGLIPSPKGLLHVHGRMGAISRLTATGWRLEVADGLSLDPEWGASFSYGRWGESLLRFDPDGTLWQSHPWRRMKTKGDAPRLSKPMFVNDGKRLIIHAQSDGATYALEKNQWRRLSISPDRAFSGSLVSTPEGVYLGASHSVWRLVGDAWQRVAHSKEFAVSQMAYDAHNRALYAMVWPQQGGDYGFAVLENDQWRQLSLLPDGHDADTAFGVDGGLRRAVMMTEAGEVWMLDLDQHPTKATLPTKAVTPKP